MLNGFEGKYQVSSCGRIRNIQTGRILKQYINNKGYFTIVLLKDGKEKNKRISRMVAEVFIENPLNLPCVNHKDENRLNNNVSNLEWCDYKYNNNYGNRIEKQRSKLHKKIGQYSLDGELIQEWESIKSASEKLGIYTSGIVDCARGHYKKCKGYRWKYL